MSLLVTKNLCKSYGGIHAVRNVSLAVQPGQRHVILGPNGAGKSTLFNLLGGAVLPSSGSIRFDDADISIFPAYKRARLGIARTFQVSQLFANLTVEENALIALFPSRLALRRFFNTGLEKQRQTERAVELLEQWGLKDDCKARVSSLSYGKQRSLEIGLALARQPRVILLDEPTAGLARNEVPRLLDVLQRLPKDISVLMIEHDMVVVREFAQWITVLSGGVMIKEGNADAIFADKEVQQLYLRVQSRD